MTDQSLNQELADKQAELEQDSRPAEKAEPSDADASESQHDVDSEARVFEHSSDNLGLENPEIEEQNHQSVAETAQPPESSDEAVHESS